MDRIKLKIIFNPSSGRQANALVVGDILHYLAESDSIARADISYTGAKDDAKNFAAALKPGEYDVVMAVGGDGTINEVVSGLMIGGSKTPLAVLSGGTVNDFATALNLPTNPSAFARMLLDGKRMDVDVGQAGDSYFLNVLAGGLMTDVAYKVPSAAKTSLGSLAYVIEGAKEAPGNLFKSIPLYFSTPSDEYRKDVLVFLVANSRSVAGIRKLFPKAELSDGLLDVLVLSKLDVTQILPLIGKYIVGDHMSDDSVLYFQTDRLDIAPVGDQEVRLDLDGEEGPLLPITIKCLPQALTLVVPKDEDED
ncbi:MAG: diacylglycerol kinase family lipid kinase [Clostridiales bacterium]|nr:diacylglycerol kinase family lipid kinase [Clostridiales bacterium]